MHTYLSKIYEYSRICRLSTTVDSYIITFLTNLVMYLCIIIYIILLVTYFTNTTDSTLR